MTALESFGIIWIILCVGGLITFAVSAYNAPMVDPKEDF